MPLVHVLLALVLPSAQAAEEPAPRAAWKRTPYVQPVAGANAFSNGQVSTVAAWGGAQAGVRYRQTKRRFPRIRGTLRTQGTLTLASGGIQGFDLRAGNFVGPQWKHLGLQAGPDFFTNAFRYGSVVAPATGGVALPVVLSGRAKSLTAYAGLEPAWLVGANRSGVDWSATDAVGVGDEFAVLAGIGVRGEKVRLGLDAQRRTTSYGTDNHFGLNLGFNAFGGQRP